VHLPPPPSRALMPHPDTGRRPGLTLLPTTTSAMTSSARPVPSKGRGEDASHKPPHPQHHSDRPPQSPLLVPGGLTGSRTGLDVVQVCATKVGESSHACKCFHRAHHGLSSGDARRAPLRLPSRGGLDGVDHWSGPSMRVSSEGLVREAKNVGLRAHCSTPGPESVAQRSSILLPGIRSGRCIGTPYHRGEHHRSAPQAARAILTGPERVWRHRPAAVAPVRRVPIRYGAPLAIS
jgi:hypothetical protein